MRITVSGATVSYTTGGRGLNPDQPLLLFIHGAALDKTVWQLQTRYFAHHGYTVMAVDLPGHGGSEGAPLSLYRGLRRLGGDSGGERRVRDSASGGPFHGQPHRP